METEKTKDIPLHPREGFQTKAFFIGQATPSPWTTAFRRSLDWGAPLQVILASLLPQLPLQAACPVWLTGAQHNYTQVHAVYYRTKSHANSGEAGWGEAKQKWLQQHIAFMNLCLRNKMCPKSVFHTELSYDPHMMPEVPSNVHPAYM